MRSSFCDSGVACVKAQVMGRTNKEEVLFGGEMRRLVEPTKSCNNANLLPNLQMQ